MEEWWLESWVPRHGRVFVDVGANVGSWTRALAAGFEQVHAIEPNPEALVQLRSDLLANVTVHGIAAWHDETMLDFALFENSVHTSHYFRGEGINTGPQTGSVVLPARRIDDLAIGGPVDFLKCDTEGAEAECLLGAEALIRRDLPELMVEVHSVRNFASVARLLLDWGYLFTVLRHPDYERHSHLWFAHCWLSARVPPSG